MEYLQIEQKIILTNKQKDALSSMLNGDNVFLTGPAGCGKTFILNRFIDEIEDKNSQLPKYSKKKIYKTSTTGISAINIGGQTLHSYAGIGLGKQDVNKLIGKIMRKSETLNRWKMTDILIIDEISMLSAELFDKLEEIARKVRKNDDIFGGIQIILSGDFAQLPIINKNATICFESKKWNKVLDKIFYFDEIMRQTDKKFQNILNKIRMGICDIDVVEAIISRKGLLDSENNIKNNNKNNNKTKNKKNITDFSFSNIISNSNSDELNIKPTILYSLNKMVENENQREYKSLIDNGNQNKNFLATVFIKNIHKKEELCNEKKITKSNNYWKNLDKLCIAPKILKLVVGAQIVVIKNIFNLGLVNGSRGIVTGFTKSGFPLVEFINGKTIVIKPETWEINLGSFEKTIKIFNKKETYKRVLTIMQLPIKLAFALSIHKSQGMTIDCVRTNIGNSIFSTGQIYTVLSRVRSLENLYIDDFNPSKIRINPKVKRFYKKLSK